MSLHSEGGPTDSAAGEPGSVEERILPRLGGHHKTVTMAQIARAAGVSQGAISSLLNDRDYGIRVSEKTRDRVFKVCRELGYIPNDLRAVVRMYPELGDACLLVSSDIPDAPRDPFIARVASAMMSAGTETPRHLVIAPFHAEVDYSEQNETLPHPVRNGTASKYILAGKPNISLMRTIVKRGFPVACLGQEIALQGVVCIVPDYAAASRMAIEFLVKKGHHQIAILSGPFGSTDFKIIELNRGVRLACEQLGVSIGSQQIHYGDLSFRDGFDASEQLLASEQKPTALFCFSDILAAGALACLHQRGIKVPGAVSVIGCGDDFCAGILHPSLTTIHLPVEQMAQTAMQELEGRVRTGATGEPKKILLPAQIIERDSVAEARL